MELQLDQILHGDCLDLLRLMPDESIDACVADVPYGLGSKEPSPEDLFMYVLGGTMSTGGDFMGKDWEIPSVAVWKEIFRVLKPGGHVLSFAGSRTADLIGFGLRMAGFESRDSIARCYPNLYWTYGSGMPKSHNIGKAIDKKLGKTRTEVIGIKPGQESRVRKDGSSHKAGWEEGPHAEGFSRPWMKDPEQVEKYHRQYAPVSEAAAQWEGWGSGLKPAAEPILVFRKPFAGTLAHNVMTYGTGGLNIDATRVRHASKEDFETHKAQVDAVREKGGVRGNSWKNDSDLSGANEVKEGGRWPANLLLEHSAACRKVGTQTIAPHPQGRDRFQKTTGGDFSEAYGNQLAQDEPEVTPVWECAEGCPVRAMDDQSGDRPSTLTGRADPNGSHEHPGTEMNPNSTFLGERTHLSKVYADAGGASRFFTQIEAEPGDSSKGRWPANLVLTHAAGCERAGTKKVKGITGGTKPPVRKGDVYAEAGGYNSVGSEQPPVKGYSEPDGSEEVEAWNCVEGCPVKALDEQSGVLKSGKDVNPTDGPVSGFFGQEMTYYSKDANYGDEGGASRFFTQVQDDDGEKDPSKGRWPANLVLQHAEGCISKGPKRVKRGSGDIKGTEPSDSTNGVYGKYSKRAPNNVGENGFETIEAWECVEGCPVREIQDQGIEMGSHAAGNKGATNHVSSKGYGGAFKPMTNNPDYHADEGGVDRFFSQFDGVPFRYIAKANRKEAGCGEFEVQHVTVKPLELMRWLVKLVTQKGGVVLDPYCGSGSTLHAAVLEGMHYIGIERDEASYAEAKRRLDIVHAREREQRESDDVFAFAMGDGA